MAGGGPRKKIEWGAIGVAFQIFTVVVAALMAYAYLNGSTSARIESLETKVKALEEGRGNE